MAERIAVLFLELPGIMRTGILILVIAGALDVCYHAAPPGWTIWMDGYLGKDGAGAHVMTLLGMVVTLLGLFASRPSAPGAGAERNAGERRSSIGK
jgi:hypothetical protein